MSKKKNLSFGNVRTAAIYSGAGPENFLVGGTGGNNN